MRGPLDIAIAGCGIAGLAAALLLRRQGHAVTLYERFDRPAPLGSGLLIQPTGLAVLERLGLAGEIAAHGAPVSRLYGRNAWGETVLDARYRDLGDGAAFGIGIHRASLFGALYDAVCAEDIAIRTGCEVSGSDCAHGGRRLHFTAAEPSPRHDLVVDALGISTPLAPPSGGWLPFGAVWTTLTWPGTGPFKAGWLEQRYERASRMAGILPTGRRRGGTVRELSLFWSLRADACDAWRRRGLGAWKREVCDLWPDCAELLDAVAAPEQLTFARYAHRTVRAPVTERMIHIGDAWHSASPQLGRGANMALLDAWALALALAERDSLERGLARAVALRGGHVRLYQRLTALFTPLYQSDAAVPALVRDLALAPLSRIGPAPRIQAALVSGLAGAPLKRLGLTMPDYPALTP
jgi:salicylate hydroxylase